MSYAIIETGGKQYKVKKDAIIDVEKTASSKDKSIHFDRVLMLADGDKVQVGEPLIKGASVTGEIVKDFKAKKTTSFSYLKRKGFHKTRGHRQPLTRVKITAIKAK